MSSNNEALESVPFLYRMRRKFLGRISRKHGDRFQNVFSLLSYSIRCCFTGKWPGSCIQFLISLSSFRSTNTIFLTTRNLATSSQLSKAFIWLQEVLAYNPRKDPLTSSKFRYPHPGIAQNSQSHDWERLISRNTPSSGITTSQTLEGYDNL